MSWVRGPKVAQAKRLKELEKEQDLLARLADGEYSETDAHGSMVRVWLEWKDGMLVELEPPGSGEDES